MSRVEKAYALYEVDGGGMGCLIQALAVGTEDECQQLQNHQIIRQRWVPTTVRPVDVLVHEDSLGVSYHILSDTEGFTHGQLKLTRLKR